ncbi:MAG: hypothetical protein QE484_10390 [Rhizobium sp.]|nr:hypothetical protein [Rhizobium sp.]
MRSLARLLLLVAALAYGAMPLTGMSAMAMPMAHAMNAAGDLQQAAASAKAMADVDCPHSRSDVTSADQTAPGDHGGMPVKMVWHCAACLTLPVHAALPDSGKPARAAEAGTFSPRLVSQKTAPLTPPPRA